MKDLVLVRDRIKITLITGTIQFADPTNGIVFAAVFRGNGRVEVIPPNPMEAQQLRFFLKQDAIDFRFSEATFSFTDKTFDEIAAKIQWETTPSARSDLASLYPERQRYREEIGFELLPRLYKGVLSTDRTRTALFAADLKTDEKNWMFFGFDALDPEEVGVIRWVGSGGARDFDAWMSFPAGGRTSIDAYADPFAKEDFHILGYQINAQVTGGADLGATTKVKVESRLAGERVWVFNLNSNLRVEKVVDEQGKPLEFFQARERKDDSLSHGDYVAVLLGEPAESGQVRTLEFRYAGKRVVRQVGDGNYFCPSTGWYPRGRNAFASRVDFEMTFRSPKRYSLVATGDKVSETLDGDLRITTWKSAIPLAVAGFAYGDYKLYTEKAGAIEVQVYANREPDQYMQSIQDMNDSPLPDQSKDRRVRAPLGSLSPSGLASQIGAEMANTIRLFEQYFGPYPYKQLAITNIPYSYGQGWPGLIYLSTLSFLDSTQRNVLGIRHSVELTDFFRAHESSHQWWGHRVGWKSYHDQWMSEGFAQFSGNLYTQFRESGKEYYRLIRADKEALMSTDLHNRRFESVGPVWMGARLGSSESPQGYNTVIYKKGGLILHMLRMMLFDPKNRQDPDLRFKEMMQDFCKAFDNKAASTEDFKAIVEKHMTRTMDLENNHRMDWFFRQYIYSTGIPHYEFHYQMQSTGDGKWKVSGEVLRTGVPENWMDSLPVYLHNGDGSMRVGFINTIQPNMPFEFVLSFKPDKVTLNDNEDTLAEIKQ